MWLSGRRSLPALPETPRSCKLVQGQPHWRKGRWWERGEKREGEKERATVCFLSPFRTSGRNIKWLQEEEVCVSNMSPSPSAYGHVTVAYASTAQTVSGMKSKPARLSLGYESQNKSVHDVSETLLKYTPHLNGKRQLRITVNDLHGGLWWMAHYEVVLFLKQSDVFFVTACLNWWKGLEQPKRHACFEVVMWITKRCGSQSCQHLLFKIGHVAHYTCSISWYQRSLVIGGSAILIIS